MDCPKCGTPMEPPFSIGSDDSPYYECPHCGCVKHRLWVAGYLAAARQRQEES